MKGYNSMEFGQNTNLTNDIFIVYDNQFSNTEQNIQEQKQVNDSKLDNLININTLLLQKMGDKNIPIQKINENKNIIDETTFINGSISFQKEVLSFLGGILGSIDSLVNIMEQKQSKMLIDENNQSKSMLNTIKNIFTIKRFDETNTDKKDYIKGIKKNNETENDLIDYNSLVEEKQQHKLNPNDFANLFDMILDNFKQTIAYQTSIDETSEHIKEILKNIDFTLYENLNKIVNKKTSNNKDKNNINVSETEYTEDKQEKKNSVEKSNNNILDRFKDMFSFFRKEDKTENKSKDKEKEDKQDKKDKKKAEEDKKNASVIGETIIFALLPLIVGFASAVTAITALANLYNINKNIPTTSAIDEIKDGAKDMNVYGEEVNKIEKGFFGYKGESLYKAGALARGDIRLASYGRMKEKGKPLNVSEKLLAKSLAEQIFVSKDETPFDENKDLDGNVSKDNYSKETQDKIKKIIGEEKYKKLQSVNKSGFLFAKSKEELEKEIMKEVFGETPAKVIPKLSGSDTTKELAKNLNLTDEEIEKSRKKEDEGFSFGKLWERFSSGEALGVGESSRDVILRKAKENITKDIGEEKASEYFKNIESQSKDEQTKILNEYIKTNLSKSKDVSTISEDSDISNKDLAKVYTENTDRVVEAIGEGKGKTPTVVNQNNINNGSGGKQYTPINKNQYQTKRK
jgi:hypothetical protein